MYNIPVQDGFLNILQLMLLNTVTIVMYSEPLSTLTLHMGLFVAPATPRDST